MNNDRDNCSFFILVCSNCKENYQGKGYKMLNMTCEIVINTWVNK